MKAIIEAENVGKLYQLGQTGTGTLTRDLERWFAHIRGKQDPLLRIGDEPRQNLKGRNNYFWSLRDVNFRIEQGSSVGIIGCNGAGKSTLLKILGRITGPSTGRIRGFGRIASLLEVGTGFHPELSGRENIFLNGAILGMRKSEIRRKFDEIVDFAGVEQFLDTPVKKYSSGMYVRLAFAVAAHLEAEILLVDEVLAVGDAEFQKKCLSKMKGIRQAEGRTVLFVSHQLGSVQSLCDKTMLLQQGRLEYMGETTTAIEKYVALSQPDQNVPAIEQKDACISFRDLQIKNDSRETLHFYFGERINIHLQISAERKIAGACVDIVLINRFNSRVFTIREPLDYTKSAGDLLRVVFRIPARFLNPGTYTIEFALHVPNQIMYDEIPPIGISITDTGYEFTANQGFHMGDIYLDSKPQYLTP